jgi:3-oxoadipate CoA-transferase alpha subunit
VGTPLAAGNETRVVDARDVDPEIVVTPGIFVDGVLDLSSMSHESTEVAS